MSQRLIDANALKYDFGEINDGSHKWWDLYVTNEAIAKQPTVNVAPERTGTWTEEYDPDADVFFRRRYRCSACNGWNTYGFTTYCPQCGAWMVNSTAVMMAKQKETDDAETD